MTLFCRYVNGCQQEDPAAVGRLGVDTGDLPEG